ncbi:MAG TPA: hypothetical protein VM537_00585, partial [Anaerolineae bacterium]|nr:hypothetical protein [Anaerolineae bacterium]
LETIVFGKRAGDVASQSVGGGPVSAELAEALRDEIAAIAALKARPSGERQGAIRQTMKRVMTDKVGVYRQEQPLAEAVESLAELKERYRSVILDNKGDTFNYDLMDTLELAGMLELAEVTAVTALQRQECRGSHWRTDHPGRNDADWMKHSMASYRHDGPPSVEYGEVIITKYQPTERKY